jgi:hypothetical protein
MAIEWRPFRLSDALVLIAALGFGLGLLVWTLGFDPHALIPIHFSSFPNFVGSLCFDLPQVVPPLAAPLTAAILVLSLRRPRPPLRRVRRSPGLVGCFVALVFLILDGAIRAIVAAKGHAFFRSVSLLEFIFDALDITLAIEVGLCVLAAWTTLLVSGCWRPSPCWQDRLGRGLSILWIAGYFAKHVYDYLFPWHD